MARTPCLTQSAGTGQPSAAGAPAASSSSSSWWRRIEARLRGRRSRQEAAHALYLALVRQAREPVFYADWGVPDTRGGRLEMVNLHAILLMRRLRREGEPGRELAQALFDLLFADLDQHLREWGVGDLSVGKQVKKLAQSFFGRAASIDPLLDKAGDGAGDEALAEMLRRNVYTEAAAPDPIGIQHLGGYLRLQDRWLAGQEGEALLAGRVAFALPRAALQAAGGEPHTVRG